MTKFVKPATAPPPPATLDGSDCSGWERMNPAPTRILLPDHSLTLVSRQFLK